MFPVAVASTVDIGRRASPTPAPRWSPVSGVATRPVGICALPGAAPPSGTPGRAAGCVRSSGKALPVPGAASLSACHARRWSKGSAPQSRDVRCLAGGGAAGRVASCGAYALRPAAAGSEPGSGGRIAERRSALVPPGAGADGGLPVGCATPALAGTGVAGGIMRCGTAGAPLALLVAAWTAGGAAGRVRSSGSAAGVRVWRSMLPTDAAASAGPG